MKQGTLTLPEHIVPHPLQGALNCIGCSVGLIFIFYSCCLFIDLWHRISILDLSAGTLIIHKELKLQTAIMNWMDRILCTTDLFLIRRHTYSATPSAF